MGEYNLTCWNNRRFLFWQCQNNPGDVIRIILNLKIDSRTCGRVWKARTVTRRRGRGLKIAMAWGIMFSGSSVCPSCSCERDILSGNSFNIGTNVFGMTWLHFGGQRLLTSQNNLKNKCLIGSNYEVVTCVIQWVKAQLHCGIRIFNTITYRHNNRGNFTFSH